MTRRLFFSLLSLPILRRFKPKPKLASECEIYRSFDARDWARHFCEHVRYNPAIATNEETMTSWFASSLMRGYDEYMWKSAGITGAGVVDDRS